MGGAEFAVDPLFRKTSAAFDQGGARGLLLNHLAVFGAATLVFDSADAPCLAAAVAPVDPSAPLIDRDINAPLARPAARIEQQLRLDATLARSLAAAAGTTLPSLPAAASTTTASSDLVPAGSAGNIPLSTRLDDMTDGDQFGGGGGLDYDDDDDDHHHHHHDDGDDNQAPAAAQRAPGGDFPAVEPSEAIDPAVDEYQQANALATVEELAELLQPAGGDGQHWAGPDHWRFGAAQRRSGRRRGGADDEAAAAAAAAAAGGDGAAAGGDGAADGEAAAVGAPAPPKAAAPKKKKQQFLIDFYAPCTFDFDKAFASVQARSGAGTTLVQAQRNDTSTTLPQDHHFDVRDLTKLFLKPRVIVPDGIPSDKQQRQQQEQNDAIREDAAGGGADQHDDDDDDDHDDDVDVGGAGLDFEGGGGGGDMSDDDGDDRRLNGDAELPRAVSGDNNNAADPAPGAVAADAAAGADDGMVRPPSRVSKIPLDYARVAKKVDVKLLKDSIRAELRLKDGADTGVSGSEFDLQSVLSHMGPRLPESLKPDVSVPFAFICLLHLANEH